MIDPVANAWTIDFPVNNPCLPQHFEMLRNSRLGQRKMIDNLAANTGFSLHKQTDDPHSSRMCQSAGEASEFLCPLEFRHWQLFLPTATLWLARHP